MLKCRTVRTGQYPPHPILSDTLACLWTAEHVLQPPHDVLDLLPDRYIELVFSFGGDAHVEWKDAVRPLPRCYLVGLLSEPCRLRARGTLKSVAARFYAWSFYPLLGHDILASNFALMAKDAFTWEPATIGAILFAFGIQDTLNQGVFVPRLLPRFGEAKIALGGMLFEVIGYSLIALAASIASAPLLVIGFVLFGFGESSFGPSLGGLLSRLAGPREQGRVQGSNHALQALARITGPILGGQLYASIGRAAPYMFNAILIAVAVVAAWRALLAVKVNVPSAGS